MIRTARERAFQIDLCEDATTLKIRPEHFQIEINSTQTLNCILLEENITEGQLIEAFNVDALVEGCWSRIADGTTVGHKRLIRFPDLRASALRILSSKGTLTSASTYCIREHE